MVSGTSGSTCHSICLMIACPLGLLVWTSMISPRSVSCATADSGRPPIFNASLITYCSTSRKLVCRRPGTTDFSEAKSGEFAASKSSGCDLSICENFRPIVWNPDESLGRPFAVVFGGTSEREQRDLRRLWAGYFDVFPLVRCIASLLRFVPRYCVMDMLLPVTKISGFF